MLVDLGDCSAIPSVATSLPGTCGRYSVLYLIGAQVLTYDTVASPGRKPATWADFWNVKIFPGRRALSNSSGPFATIISALIADGVRAPSCPARPGPGVPRAGRDPPPHRRLVAPARSGSASSIRSRRPVVAPPGHTPAYADLIDEVASAAVE